MTIKQSVGENGENDKTDVKIIQAALNQVETSDYNVQLDVDGLIGTKTIQAIGYFQQLVMDMQNPDARVDPNGQTLSRLKQAIKKELTLDVLLAIMAPGSRNRIEPFYAPLKAALEKYNMDTPLRSSHFLAQIGHESLSFRYTEEIASGEAYEGRGDLGNTEPGDGKRFKGRGLIQLTGRANYKAYGEYADLDLLAPGNETIVSTEPKYALDVAFWFWNSRHLNDYADADDIKTITKRINGGYNGLDDRQAYLDRAKFFLL